MGEPFSGVVEHYEAGILVGAYEYEDGHIWGLQQDYYPDGSPKAEWYIGITGREREWDESGHLTWDNFYGEG